MFEEALNLSANPQHNHVYSNGLVNILEVEDLMSLKVFLNRVYEIIVIVNTKKNSVKGLTNINVDHSEEGHIIN